jgi:hypothetical protein
MQLFLPKIEVELTKFQIQTLQLVAFTILDLSASDSVTPSDASTHTEHAPATSAKVSLLSTILFCVHRFGAEAKERTSPAPTTGRACR